MIFFYLRINYSFKQYQRYFWGTSDNGLNNKLNQMMGLTQSPFQDNGTATWRKWSKQVTETVQLFLISGWSTQSWTQRENMWRDRSEIPEREEIVNWNDMKDVFWTALATSDVEEHKYGSYPHKWNDKTPLIMIKEPYDFFFHAGSMKTFDQCKPSFICFFLLLSKQTKTIMILQSCCMSFCLQTAHMELLYICEHIN